MRYFLSFTFALLLNGLVYGQANPWSDINETGISAAPQARMIIPSRYRTQHLDLLQLKSHLATAPQEAEFVAGEPGMLLDFPLPDGGYSAFEVWEAPVMDPALSAKYPTIRSYAGRNRQGDYIRFDVSPTGLHAMILPIQRSKVVFIDPYARGNEVDYICYFKNDLVRPEDKFMDCLVTDDLSALTVETDIMDRAGSCGNLRTYRLALACTGEYAFFHGAIGTNKAPALAAMNTTMTRVNGVFEIDAGLRMIIVANNENVIYTDAGTDPYTNNNGSSMLGQNQTACNTQIGSANYDIGHVFSTGGGGVAYLSCVCGSSKAGGVTGSSSPVGDAFDIDYVIHEMGHQFGAEHTQYNNCNRSNASAMEPGSASTIMGYAGICSPNVQNNSDDYFHARSIGQIATFINGTGNGCANLVPNGNSAPSCAALVNRTIPKSTPFVLTASGSDPNGDALTYCWEQMDAYKSPSQPMPPTTTNKTGPVFRSVDPGPSPSRYFPIFGDVLNNTSGTWEKLPSISRSLNFRVTVRDNHANGGCTTEKDMVVTVAAAAGPFVVTLPNTAVNWLGNSSQTITWNVAGTTGNGVNCANVAILLSTDGGASFTTLVSSTPNDGTQGVTIPNVGTTQARILIQAVGNVFYDVSNVNFTITAVQPLQFGGSSRSSGPSLHVFPNPTSGLIQVHTPANWQVTPLMLRIRDVEGRIVLEDQAFISGQTVEVTRLIQGIYQVEVILNGEKQQCVFVRQ